MSEHHNRRHPPEFRAEAVRLATRPGNTIRGIGRDLGVDPATLRGWIAESRPPAPPPVPLDAHEREELGRLRRKVRVLEEEREILKKAAAFFARETDGTR